VSLQVQLTPFLALCLEHIVVIIWLKCSKSGLLLLITVKQKKTNKHVLMSTKNILSGDASDSRSSSYKRSLY